MNKKFFAFLIVSFLCLLAVDSQQAPPPPPPGSGSGFSKKNVSFDGYLLYKDIIEKKAPDNISKLYKKIKLTNLNFLDKVYNKWKNPPGNLSGKEVAELKKKFQVFACFKKSDDPSLTEDEKKYCLASEDNKKTEINAENILNHMIGLKNLSEWQIEDILNKAIERTLGPSDSVARLIIKQGIRDSYYKLDQEKRDVICGLYQKILSSQNIQKKIAFRSVFKALSKGRLGILQKEKKSEIKKVIQSWLKAYKPKKYLPKKSTGFSIDELKKAITSRGPGQKLKNLEKDLSALAAHCA